jgi:hypothetical protein
MPRGLPSGFFRLLQVYQEIRIQSNSCRAIPERPQAIERRSLFYLAEADSLAAAAPQLLRAIGENHFTLALSEFLTLGPRAGPF